MNRESVAPSADSRATVLLLTLVVVLAWGAVLNGPTGAEGGPVIFVAAWTAMMAAMMLPSAAPLVLLYRRGTSSLSTVRLALGYLAVWAAIGLPAYYLHTAMLEGAGPLALAAAGAYQLTPLKQGCLHHCRTPADYLMQRWGRGSFRLGVEHGLWCAGCCWALMLVLVLTGSMGLVWVVGIALVVAAEKLTKHGVLWARLTGLALLLEAFIQGMIIFSGT